MHEGKDPSRILQTDQRNAGPLSILMTNIVMSARSGTEIMTAELALALRARGHRVVVYTPSLGASGLDLMGRGVPVTSRIELNGFTPDIIHGHHNVASAVAMVRFPHVPAIFVCHDTALQFDDPILCRRIGAYVAIDAACRERLIIAGVPERRITNILNGVDLTRFTLRKQCAARPQRALAITKASAPWLEAVREACRLEGISLEAVGLAVGRIVDTLPRLCAEADIVFAMSRSAMEAAATGAAVVICDERGFGGLLLPEEVERWPDTAIWRRLFLGPVTVDVVRDAITRYRAEEVMRSAQLLREKMSLDAMTDRYERLYVEVLRGQGTNSCAPGEHGWTGPSEDTAPLAGFIASLLPRVDGPADFELHMEQAEQRRKDLGDWLSLHRSGQSAAHEIHFGRGGSGRMLLESGWHTIEDWGVWARDPVATLLLPAGIIAGWGGSITLRGHYYFPPSSGNEQCREIEVFVNRQPVSTWHFFASQHRDIHSLTLQIPLDFVQSGGSLEVTFRMSQQQSPLESGENLDPRKLSLGLVSIGATADEMAA